MKRVRKSLLAMSQRRTQRAKALQTKPLKNLLQRVQKIQRSKRRTKSLHLPQRNQPQLTTEPSKTITMTTMVRTTRMKKRART
jgi:hypothetical protein